MSVRSELFDLSTPFSDKTSSHYVTSIQLYKSAVNFDGGNVFHLYQPNFFTELSSTVAGIAHQLIPRTAPATLLYHLLYVAPSTYA